jgi:imidazolonepropionase-like amidohydrolase
MLHHELELWVKAGAAPAEVLARVTGKAAQRLGAGARTGLLQPGYEATAVLVEGNPLADISATARIVTLFFKGERVNRASLFEQFEKK